jgi:hypothetical protein
MRYLKGLVERGLICEQTQHLFEVWTDDDVLGLQNKDTETDNPSISKSRTRHVAMYAGFPSIWCCNMPSSRAKATGI